MTLVERYIFRTVGFAFLAALGALTGVIWLTQALREFDLLTTKGQALLTFLTVTGLSLPSLSMIIAPVALFIAVMYALNKLNGDSELIVMSAAGLAPIRLFRPFAVLAVLVACYVALMSLVVMPWSFFTLRDLISKIQSDFLTRVVREGQFVNLEAGFTFHYRERGKNGELLGVFMQDRRNPEQSNTYIAEVGVTAVVDDKNYLVLDKGSIQRQGRNSLDPAMVAFQRYAIDLAQLNADGEAAPLKPRERTTLALLTLDPNEPYIRDHKLLPKFSAELHDRFVNPLYALAFAMIAFSALGIPRTTRQGRSLSMGIATIALVSLRLLGFGATGLVGVSAIALPLVYGLPLAAIAFAAINVFAPNWKDWRPQWAIRQPLLATGPAQ